MTKKISHFIKFGRVLSEEDSSSLFEEIYYTKASKIKKQVFYIVGNNSYEDVLQEVFFKIHKNLNKFSGQSSIDTWIYRIALNTSLDFLKKEKRQFDIESSHSNFYDQDLESKELILKAISKLSDKQKKCFILFYITEEPINSIGKILKISEGTVKSRLNASRKIVKDFFKENGVNYE